KSYLPHDAIAVVLVAAALAVELALGFALARLPGRHLARLLAWVLTAASTFAVERITSAEPAGVRMVALILALLYGLKAIVAVESGVRLTPVRWLGFCVLWFGMRPGLFVKAGGPPLPGSGPLLAQGSIRLLVGCVLVAA